MNQRKRPASAYSLLEVQVALILGALLMAASTMLIASLLRGDQAFRDQRWQRQSLARLEAQFRADVHDAREVTLINSQTCQLTFETGEVRSYSLHSGRVIRQVEMGQKTVHRDDFQLLGMTGWKWQIENSSPTKILSLKILAQPNYPDLSPQSPPTLLQSGLHETTILAAVGISASAGKTGDQP